MEPAWELIEAMTVALGLHDESHCKVPLSARQGD